MMLTAMAVVVGAAVILSDPIFQGLAISLMAGEIASLFISRMAVPGALLHGQSPFASGILMMGVNGGYGTNTHVLFNGDSIHAKALHSPSFFIVELYWASIGNPLTGSALKRRLGLLKNGNGFS